MISWYKKTLLLTKSKITKQCFPKPNFDGFNTENTINIYISSWHNNKNYDDMSFGILFEQNNKTVYYDTRFTVYNKTVGAKEYLADALGIMFALQTVRLYKFKNVIIYNKKIPTKNYKNSNFNSSKATYNMLLKTIRRDSIDKPIVNFKKVKTEEEIQYLSDAYDITKY